MLLHIDKPERPNSNYIYSVFCLKVNKFISNKADIF